MKSLDKITGIHRDETNQMREDHRADIRAIITEHRETIKKLSEDHQRGIEACLTRAESAERLCEERYKMLLNAKLKGEIV